MMLGAFDQALSSFGNFVFTIFGALLLDAVGFGQLAVIFAVYLIANGIVRSVTSDVYIVSPRDTDTALSSTEAACIETCVLLSAVLAGVLALASVGLSDLRGPLLVLCVCFPLLSLQDTLRYIAFGRGQPSLAVISDAVWTVATLAVVGVLAGTNNASTVSLVAAWAGTGAVAGILAFTMMRLPASLFAGRRQAKRIRRWLSEHRRLYPYYVVDTLAAQASGALVLFLLTGISGFVAAGALRAAQLLFNPVVVLVNSVRIWAIPELVRAQVNGTRLWRRRSRQLAVVMTGACAIWSAAVVLAPAEVILKLLGESAATANGLLWPTAILVTVTGGVSTPIFAAIRSLGEAVWGLWARLISASAMLVAAAVGALLAAESGAAWGMALAMPIVAAASLFGLHRSIARARRRQVIDAEQQEPRATRIIR